MKNRVDLLALDDLPVEKIYVEEWDTTIYVRGLTATERDAFESDLIRQPKRKQFQNIRAKLLVLCLCDAQGMPVFLLQDVHLLGKKSAKVLDRLFAMAQRLSGMGAEDSYQRGVPLC